MENRPCDAGQLFFKPAKPPKQLADFWADSFEFFPMDRRKSLQDFFATIGKLNENLSPILSGGRTHYQFIRHQPINQANRAVVAKL